MELEEDYQRKGQSGQTTETAYTVEARYNYRDPAVICGQVFDNRWRRVEFKEGTLGVPACPRYRKLTIECGMLGYSAAQALRWWLHATAEAELGLALPLETRIVSHKIRSSYEVEAQGYHGLVTGEDRSNTFPDWKENREAV